MSGRRLGRLLGSLLLLAAVLGGLGAGSLSGGKAQLADVVWGAGQDGDVVWGVGQDGDVVWGASQGDVVWGASQGDVVWGVDASR
ncbi:hypothetical protein [Micromonospora sp. NPDC047527]|uniref:hypothetical protein n=1 Tax=unclassified Micromonospora TaxID=2617518 RepID=UPI0033C801DF